MRLGLTKREIYMLALPAELCVVLFLARSIYTHSSTYWFLLENLALAFVPLLVSWILVNNLKRMPWKSLPNVILSALWLLFLPNAWYVLTDFIHTIPTGQIAQLYDVVLVTSLVIAGFIYGFTSLFLIHKELLRRLSFRASAIVIAGVLLLSSFAIYLGRDLRWSSWDVVANPAGVSLDVSDQVIHPFSHSHSWDMTASVFLLLGTIYICVWVGLESIGKTGDSS